MIERAHIDAVIPDTYQVLGLELKPFCLGHFFILQKDVPQIIDGEKETTLAEFLFCCAICSMSYEDGLKYRTGDTGITSKWVKNLMWTGFFRRSKRIDWQAKRKLFQHYLESGLASPKFFVADGDGTMLGAHWSEGLLQTLLSCLHIPFSQAMNMHLPLARRLLLSYYESHNGKKILYSAKDEEDERFARDVMERWKNGKS